VDPREIDFPDVGLVVLEDSETGEQIFVDTSDPALRRRLSDTAYAREERVDAAFRRAGVEPFTIDTDEDLVGALVRLASQRKRSRRR